MNRRITAIIPCYNDGEFLPGAIESCLRQTEPVAEVIVVDDGSTEDVTAHVGDYRDEVTLIHTANRGAAAARNTGVAAAETAYVAFLDADDRWHETKIETQVTSLEREPTIDLLYTDSYLVDRSGRLLGYNRARPAGPAFAAELFVSSGSILPSSAVVRTAAFDAVDGFDETLETGHDRDLWIRLGLDGRVQHIPRPLVYRTARPNSLASNYLQKFENETRSTRKLLHLHPAFEPLLADRLGEMRCKRAAYLLASGETRAARSDALRSLTHNYQQRKPLLIAGLSLFPGSVAARVWRLLQTVNRRSTQLPRVGRRPIR